jgi:hypothetical protein
MRTFCLATVFLLTHPPHAHGSAVPSSNGYASAYDRRYRNRRHRVGRPHSQIDGDADTSKSRQIFPGDSRQFAMASMVIGQERGAAVLLAGAVVVCLQKVLKSQSVRRAASFWFHAGPIVAHYKFTKWWLTKTKAPLEKRNLVYNSLHDNYCNQALQIALNLKGLYVKVRIGLLYIQTVSKHILLLTREQSPLRPLSLPKWYLVDQTSFHHNTLTCS